MHVLCVLLYTDGKVTEDIIQQWLLEEHITAVEEKSKISEMLKVKGRSCFNLFVLVTTCFFQIRYQNGNVNIFKCYTHTFI